MQCTLCWTSADPHHGSQLTENKDFTHTKYKRTNFFIFPLLQFSYSTTYLTKYLHIIYVIKTFIHSFSAAFNTEQQQGEELDLELNQGQTGQTPVRFLELS